MNFEEFKITIVLIIVYLGAFTIWTGLTCSSIKDKDRAEKLREPNYPAPINPTHPRPNRIGINPLPISKNPGMPGSKSDE